MHGFRRQEALPMSFSGMQPWIVATDRGCSRFTPSYLLLTKLEGKRLAQKVDRASGNPADNSAWLHSH